uniref:Uncharacterized protein n=1 Tax=Arundo donax TaxID=35708 RepID=A0A0A9SQH2_ARUDO
MSCPQNFSQTTVTLYDCCTCEVHSCSSRQYLMPCMESPIPYRIISCRTHFAGGAEGSHSSVTSLRPTKAIDLVS